MTNLSTQMIRSALSDYGFVPLVKIQNAEHWARGGQRAILHHGEDTLPEQDFAWRLLHATAIVRGDLADGGHIEISTH
jgi:hypothetical protein